MDGEKKSVWKRNKGAANGRRRGSGALRVPAVGRLKQGRAAKAHGRADREADTQRMRGGGEKDEEKERFFFRPSFSFCPFSFSPSVFFPLLPLSPLTRREVSASTQGGAYFFGLAGIAAVVLLAAEEREVLLNAAEDARGPALRLLQLLAQGGRRRLEGIEAAGAAAVSHCKWWWWWAREGEKGREESR